MKLEITCIEDAAAYLKKCSVAVEPKTGRITFRPGKYGDLSSDVAEFFRSNPIHRVTVSANPFLTMNEDNLKRLNDQLPDSLRISIDGAQDISKRYTGRS